MACAIRVNPWMCRYRPVCSPVRGTLPYGASCQDHDECESALCMGRVCTRPCATFVDCQGLWPGSSCQIFGLSADPQLVPDLWHMADLFPKAVNELMLASGLGPATEVVDAFGL